MFRIATQRIRPLFAPVWTRHLFTSSAMLTAITDVKTFIEAFNREYESKHKAYEDNFWATKMKLQGNSTEKLTTSKSELDEFLGNKNMLHKVREFLKLADLSKEDEKTLKIFERTFLCYIIEDPEALALRDQIGVLEAELATARNNMELGYIKDGKFVKASSVQLRNVMRTSDSEVDRRACYEAMRGIGTFVAEKFCEIVKLRNKLARSLGYEDFYDMKVSQAEGFSKKVLFGILDQLEERSRPLLSKALNTLAQNKGPSAVLPYNMGYNLSGETAKLKDPYFPFESAVDVWTRSFAALGISYAGATMRLDLCDRPGKYSNGFCHWPQPAWKSQKDGWIPSQANFTSLASPKSVGSGLTALVTLMHEGGHAAHFANVTQPSPLFSQERAPTSVAYAENQSMFLDSLVSDATWMARYALSREGKVIPWEVIEQDIKAVHAYKVFDLRAMIAVPFFERKLYELPTEDVTPANVIALADQVEREIQGELSGRPLLSVPHILSDESAAYYHGYVLAEMSVQQTRAHFLSTYAEGIVDNSNVGRDLKNVYWAPGNSEMFLDLVKKLTGKPLSGDAWIHELEVPLEQKLESERKGYQEGLKAGPKYSAGTNVDLDMNVLLVHGDDVIADSRQTQGLAEACKIYKNWVAGLDF
ncbi:oligoendopeptidase [Polychytrium aggregatum]|uniref:oligoendopeptidase n=1 Tax=Polychytrium aggregatum TaxID=110093 RepID=UPI0022FE988E|nr:oligoendopeptidase [Polychytrium aggregatum]KAI9206249.1 oligoendopeptidase [Polychytrium aggregatum]